MSSLTITKNTNDLRRHSNQIDSDNIADALLLAKKMKQELLRVNGVGLSAIQVGEPISLFIINFHSISDVYINPRILKKSKATTIDLEGCLSSVAAGLTIPIERHNTVLVEYINKHGYKVIDFLVGIHARIFQHEMDHLNGILIEDYKIS